MSQKCIEETGHKLSSNNEDIVRYLCGIENERQTLEDIIQKQYQERKRIEIEIEKLTYKLCLINKSLSMRIKAKNNYDKTIEEIQSHYSVLVDSSNKLRNLVEKTQADLDDIMNKKIGTGTGENIPPGLTPLTDPTECPCDNTPEEPTRLIKTQMPPGSSSATTPIAYSTHSVTSNFTSSYVSAANSTDKADLKTELEDPKRSQSRGLEQGSAMRAASSQNGQQSSTTCTGQSVDDILSTVTGASAMSKLNEMKERELDDRPKSGKSSIFREF
ncbi:uncharacterized protein LOC115881506 [Sitophilus oryzae]|uniref:Uncharacterized protein LOC115881506 n=1 Tax=Sitophilus oryzae TaxID=7048 RepID=A0A6J2XV06_SITOR|nr:uncharacterized protein LOC115881506 [Sitophilus oryzae]